MKRESAGCPEVINSGSPPLACEYESGERERYGERG